MGSTRKAFVCLLVFAHVLDETWAGTVEANWPKGKPNPCLANSLFFDFEDGLDGNEIKNTKPGLKFTNTAGLDWVYGKSDECDYNVEYTWNGNGFAWLGETGDSGRIDFTGGGATRVSALVSCFSAGLTFDAYDADHNLLDTAKATSNVGTTTTTRLTVESPDSRYIDYVMVHDSGNFWAIDDVCTDARPPCFPIPGYTYHTATEDHFDFVFVRDVNFTGTNEDFENSVKKMIDERFLAIDPVKGHDDIFNFYLSYLPADSVNGTNRKCGERTLPQDFRTLCPFADAVAVVHSETYQDCCSGSVFSTEGDIIQSFIHEAGHAVFGLSDEYDDAPECGTGRPWESTNIYVSLEDCENDASAHGVPTSNCTKFTTCQNYKCDNFLTNLFSSQCNNGYWKIDDGTDTVMDSGRRWRNGYSPSSTWRIEEWLKQYDDGTIHNYFMVPFAEVSPNKAIVVTLEISDEGVQQLEPAYVVLGPPPEFTLSSYDFYVNFHDSSGNQLGEFGFRDPRVFQYHGRYLRGLTTGDDDTKVVIQIVLPHIASNHVAIVSNQTHGELLSVDLSATTTGSATNLRPIANCTDITVDADPGGNCDCNLTESEIIGAIDGGSYDPDGDNITLSASPLGPYSNGTKVQLTVTDSKGATSTCMAVVTVNDTEPLEEGKMHFLHPGLILPNGTPSTLLPKYDGKENGCPTSVFISGVSCMSCSQDGSVVASNCAENIVVNAGSIDVLYGNQEGSFMEFSVGVVDTNTVNPSFVQAYTICLEDDSQTFCPTGWTLNDSDPQCVIKENKTTAGSMKGKKKKPMKKTDKKKKVAKKKVGKSKTKKVAKKKVGKSKTKKVAKKKAGKSKTKKVTNANKKAKKKKADIFLDDAP
eukprot:scaffold34917_cov166-Amphora_coffeaeformis.AAC.2